MKVTEGKKEILTEGSKGNKGVGRHLLLYLNSGFQQDWTNGSSVFFRRLQGIRQSILYGASENLSDDHS
jgi:hypothetical protein